MQSLAREGIALAAGESHALAMDDGAWSARLTRRTFLGLLVASPCLAGEFRPPGDRGELEVFLRLSEEATGFERLDEALARRYLQSLRRWEPGLAALLQTWRPGDLPGLTGEQLKVVDQIIEAWYTGTVPTALGTEVVSYRGALAYACLPRHTPVTFCRD
jgi:hypothetical protein